MLRGSIVCCKKERRASFPTPGVKQTMNNEQTKPAGFRPRRSSLIVHPSFITCLLLLQPAVHIAQDLAVLLELFRGGQLVLPFGGADEQRFDYIRDVRHRKRIVWRRDLKLIIPADGHAEVRAAGAVFL